MEYSLNLNSRPFEAIKNGTKKIEGRVPTGHDKNVPFSKIKKGDTIIFNNNFNKDIIKVRVLGIRHYSTFKEMLESIENFEFIFQNSLRRTLMCFPSEKSIIQSSLKELKEFYLVKEMLKRE